MFLNRSGDKIILQAAIVQLSEKRQIAGKPGDNGKRTKIFVFLTNPTPVSKSQQ